MPKQISAKTTVLILAWTSFTQDSSVESNTIIKSLNEVLCICFCYIHICKCTILLYKYLYISVNIIYDANICYIII